MSGLTPEFDSGWGDTQSAGAESSLAANLETEVLIARLESKDVKTRNESAVNLCESDSISDEQAEKIIDRCLYHSAKEFAELLLRIGSDPNISLGVRLTALGVSATSAGQASQRAIAELTDLVEYGPTTALQAAESIAQFSPLTTSSTVRTENVIRNLLKISRMDSAALESPIVAAAVAHMLKAVSTELKIKDQCLWLYRKLGPYRLSLYPQMIIIANSLKLDVHKKRYQLTANQVISEEAERFPEQEVSLTKLAQDANGGTAPPLDGDLLAPSPIDLDEISALRLLVIGRRAKHPGHRHLALKKFGELFGPSSCRFLFPALFGAPNFGCKSEVADQIQLNNLIRSYILSDPEYSTAARNLARSRFTRQYYAYNREEKLNGAIELGVAPHSHAIMTAPAMLDRAIPGEGKNDLKGQFNFDSPYAVSRTKGLMLEALYRAVADHGEYYGSGDYDDRRMRRALIMISSPYFNPEEAILVLAKLGVVKKVYENSDAYECVKKYFEKTLAKCTEGTKARLKRVFS